MFAPASESLPVESQLRFTASIVNVSWTRKDYVSAARDPTASDAPAASIAQRPPTTGHERFVNVTGFADSWTPEANWMLVVGHDQSTVALNATGWEVRPSSNTSWRVGHAAEIRQQLLDGANLVHEETVPGGTPLARSSTAPSVAMLGDAWLYAWGLNVTIVDESGRKETFASGFWTDNETAEAVHPGGVAREDHAQFLAIHLQAADLSMKQTQGDLFAAAADLRIVGPISARFDDARGAIAGLASHVMVDGQALELDGDLVLDVGRATDAERLSITAEGQAHHVRVDGTPVPDAVAARQDVPASAALALVVLFLGGLLVWAARTGLRRRRMDPVERAENLVLEKRPERARRVLRRFLARRPDDVAAWFLLGATWLQENAPERLIQEIEPVARRLHGPDLASLAFLLAISHARLRRTEETLEWLPKAARDPTLRTRAAQEPAFAFLQGDARFRSLVASEAPAYG